MIVLGIDPGTIQMGFGVIRSEDDRVSYVDCGVLKASSSMPLEKRIHKLYLELKKIVAEYEPDVVAVEKPFVAKNVQAAMAIGQAQAVAILAASEQSVPVFQYLPTKIKGAIANYGASGKEQVKQMVWLQLGMKPPVFSGRKSNVVRPDLSGDADFAGASSPSDPTDALAVAICHSYEARLARILERTR